MPTYEYQCPRCGQTEERILKLAQLDDPQLCLECHGHMERKVSAGNFALKGQNWSRDGYTSRTKKQKEFKWKPGK